MKKIIIILIFVIGVVSYSCTPDEYSVFDFDSNPSQVDSMELVPNSHILYADGVSELNIDIRAFDIVEVWRKEKVSLPDGSFTSKDSLYKEVYKVKNSRIAEDILFFKEDGTELPANAKISTTTVEDFKVYAQIGDVQSEMLQIDVREAFPVQPKLVIPVIFHVLESEGVTMEPSPAISTKYFQNELDKLNPIFSQRYVNASNGANANIEFKLALYAPDGTLLEEKGIDRQQTTLAGEDMQPALVENTWDTQKYMNIFVCTYPWESNGYRKFTKLAGVEPLPGLNFIAEVEADDELDLSIPENTGIIIGADGFGTNYFFALGATFDFLSEFGRYLGLKETRSEDYCSDTYTYGNDQSSVEFWIRNTDGFLFHPTNIMTAPSSQSVITAEQVERIRWVLENCPTHWAWKSDFAFTGTE